MRIEDATQDELDAQESQLDRLCAIVNVYNQHSDAMLSLLEDCSLDYVDFHVEAVRAHNRLVSAMRILRDQRDSARAEHLLADAGVLD